ncbi:MAG: hypothetical protein LC781_15555 [Actinobacteria bacterium]|nr:hypothetical protein [Actinomycetota bacterium]
MTGEPLKGERASGEYTPEKAPAALRVGHLLRINSYLDYAMLSMWAERRARVVMGMAEASVRGTGPGGAKGPDEEVLARLRDLIGEAREYHEAGDFQAAMCRMRIAQDLVTLRIIRLTGA